MGELETLDEILHRNDWVKLLSLNPKAPRIVQIERHDRNPEQEKPHLIHHVRITETHPSQIVIRKANRKETRNAEQKQSDALQLLRTSTLARFAGLLRKKILVNVGQNTTLCDGDVTQKLVQLLVITYEALDDPKMNGRPQNLRIANCKWRGIMRVFLLSRAALPANSRISAARYSRTAAR